MTADHHTETEFDVIDRVLRKHGLRDTGRLALRIDIALVNHRARILIDSLEVDE